MKDLTTLDNSALYDLLSDQTVVYTRLLAGHHRTSAFKKSKEMIIQLQREIEFRKNVCDPSPGAPNEVTRSTVENPTPVDRHK